MRLLITALSFVILTAPAAAATWREASSDNFTVYSDGGEAELVNFTRRAERFDQVLRIMCGVQQPPAAVKVRIFLVDGSRTVTDLITTHQPNIGGFYTTRIDGGLAVADRTRASDLYELDGQTIIYHEYVHHFVAQYAPTVYPIWYQEGFAEYFSATTINSDGTADVGHIDMARLPSIYWETWLPTERLMDSTLADIPNDRKGEFYAQSWLLTHYLLTNATRHDQLTHYLDLRAQGLDHKDALQKAFVVDDAQLGRELHAYSLGNHFVSKRLIPSSKSTIPVAVRVVSQPEADGMLASARLRIGVAEPDEKKLLSDIHALATRYPDDLHTQSMLAEAEARYGDHARARDLLQSMVSAHPQERRALLTLAELELTTDQPDDAARLAADRRARSLAVKANKLSPDDPEALFQFYRSFAHEPAGRPKNALDGLHVAHMNIPQYEPLAIAQAHEYLQAGNSTSALAVLRPIAFSVHRNKGTDEIRSWIQDIEAKQSPAVADATAARQPADGSKDPTR